VVGSLSVASHAAGALLWVWLAMTADWLHALGVAFWVGGLMALVLILPPALRPHSGKTRRQALLAVMRRFSRLAGAAVIIVIVTGLYSALTWLYTPADLTQTTYGAALILKGLLVALLLLVAALHHAALNPSWVLRLERLTSTIPGALRRRLIRLFYRQIERAIAFAATLRLEALLALVVLITVSLLSATPVPEPVFLQHETAAPTATQTVADRQIVLTLTPGGPGVNTYDILITLGNAPEEALDVRLQWVNPDRDWRGQWQQAETVDSGLYITAGDEIDRQGYWWALLDISDSTEISTRVAFDWTISTEASVPQTRDPTVLNGIALAGVALALGWVSYPTVRRYAPLFDFNRTNVTAALSILLITGLLGALSIGLLQEQDRRYRETLNPPPDVINTILPDAASLERGAALYARHCIEWQSSSRDFSALRNRLATMRDDALYAVTRDGWRSLPPCQGDLSDGQRWDIVNYVRSFAS
jgi:uncharacterized membrane protein